MTYEEAKAEILTTSVMVLESVRKKRKFEKAIRKAIEALEKQIPKKVVWTDDWTWGVHTPQPVCPVCDYYLITTHFIGEGEGKGKKVSYCDTCGQAVDWSE